MVNKPILDLSALIIDDFSSFRFTLNGMLVEYGLRDIDSVGTAKDALKLSKSRHYDIVFCDYNLGKGKNGQQLLEEFRETGRLRRQDIFILLSAETSRNVVMSAYDCEPDAYLTKPVTNKIIDQRMRRLLARRKELLGILQALDDKKHDRCIELLRQKIADNSRYSMDCQKLLAEVLISTKAYDEAEAVFVDVLAMRSLNWAQVGLAQVKLLKGDGQKSAEWLQDIIEANPSYTRAYDVLADAYEDLGDDESLQGVLSRAVEVSPLSLHRQVNLAEVAMKNGDAEVAANALRKIMRNCENTRYDTLENHLNYARSVSQLFDQDMTKALDMGDDALRLLKKAEDKFDHDNKTLKRSDLLACQILSLQGERKKAEDQFDLLPEEIDPGEKVIDIEIDKVNVLVSLNRSINASQMLDEMVLKYQGDEEALQKIDPLLSEPVSAKGKKALVKVIKTGIGAYKQNRFDEAVDCFIQAEKRFPRYLGIKLNLAQSLIGRIKLNGADEEDVNRCLSVFDVVKRYIRQDHNQYKRFMQLQEMLRLAVNS